MKSSLLLSFFLLFTIISTGQGFGDWQNSTPGGNVFYNSGGGTMLSLDKRDSDIEGIKRWYFYKDYIVGETYDGFFVVDEHNGNYREFQNENEWKSYIKQASLDPKIWTRWFSDNWRFYEQAIFILILIGIPVSVILFFYLIWMSINILFRHKRLKISKRTVFVLAGIILLILGRAILDYYPQSF